MFRKLLLKLLIRLYLGRNRDINKLSSEQEFNKFLFKDSLSTQDIIRTYLTRSTLTYWEARSEYERNVEKGGALVLKLLLDLHWAANEADKEKIPKNKVQKFVNLKNNLLAKENQPKNLK